MEGFLFFVRVWGGIPHMQFLVLVPVVEESATAPVDVKRYRRIGVGECWQDEGYSHWFGELKKEPPAILSHLIIRALSLFEAPCLGGV